jgi:hypothetical protein
MTQTQFTKQVDKDRDLTVVTVAGQVFVADLLREMRAFYDGPCTSKVLCDFSGAKVSDLTVDVLRRFVAEAKDLARLRPSGRTALVGQGAGYGMARMYEALSSITGHPIPIAAFKTTTEALSWLLQE